MQRLTATAGLIGHGNYRCTVGLVSLSVRCAGCAGSHQGVRPVKALRFLLCMWFAVCAGAASAQSLCIPTTVVEGVGTTVGLPMTPSAFASYLASNPDVPGVVQFCVVPDEPSGQPPRCPSGSAMYQGYCSVAGAGSPGYQPPLVPGGAPDSPIAPTATPFNAQKVLGLAGAALAIAGGLAAALGAAPIVVTGLAAAALHAGVAAIVASPVSSPTAQSAMDSANPPIVVKLAAALTAAPAPAVGDTSPPSIVTNPNGQFAPGGGGAFDGNGATGGWAPRTGGATGEWQYTPPASAANPTPVPTAAITAGGYGAVQQLGTNSSGTSVGALTVERASDGSIAITQAATMSANTVGGTPTTAAAAVVSAYLPNGVAVPGGGGVAVAPTLGNGQPSNGGAGLNFPGGTLGTGATPDSTASGGCGAGGTCETTQLANKGILTAIYEFLGGTSTPPVAPTAKTTAEIKAASVSGASGPFGSLLAWGLPAHTSTCPTASFDWSGATYTFDAHCQLVSDHFGVIRTVLTAMFSLSALFIVLRA